MASLHPSGAGIDELPPARDEVIHDQPPVIPIDHGHPQNLEPRSFANAKQMRGKETLGHHATDLLHRIPIPITTPCPTIFPAHYLFLGRVTAFMSEFAETEFAFAIMFCCLISLVEASDGEPEISDGHEINSLFINIAPILALFGEQVTKQFMSESMGWVDNLMFATAPVGIITGVVSAIRVAGPRWMKAMIGRSREGRANVELELMSSNSLEVGEMWNGQTIVRVLGTPPIYQLVYSTEGRDNGPEHYIKSLHDENGFFKPVVRGSSQSSHTDPYHPEYHFDGPIELHRLLPGPLDDSYPDGDQLYPPNISLNARPKPPSQGMKWVLAICGVVLQISVLFFQGYSNYYNRMGEEGYPATTGFLFSLTGTVALFLGMLINSYVVVSASTETEWVRRGNDGQDGQLNVAWIQKGGTVGDQLFEPYIIFGDKNQRTIRTSHRSCANTGAKHQYWVLSGTFLSLLGFLVQFSGLRAMNVLHTLLQLVVTVIMTSARTFIRRTRQPMAIEIPKGHELDCMARKIAGCDAWKALPGGSRPPAYELLLPHREIAQQVVQIRRHLGGLTQWQTDVEPLAAILCAAVEKTMDTLWRSDEIHLADEFMEAEEVSWRLGVLTLAEKSPEHDICGGEVLFKLTRSRLLGTWLPWAMSHDTKREIMAVLSLSLLRFREEEREHRKHKLPWEFRDPGKIVKVLGAWPRGIEQDYLRCWLRTQVMDLQFGRSVVILGQERVPAYCVIGNLEPEGDNEDSAVVVGLDASVETLFAQQLYSDFFSTAVSWIKSISGSTSIRNLSDLSDRNSHLVDPQNTDALKNWVIGNSAIDQLVETVCQTGLGEKPEVLMSMVPHLQRQGRLPLPLVESGNLAQPSFLELSSRILRLKNRWHILAHEVQLLVGDRDAIYTKSDLGSWGTKYLATRFCKRVLALATPDENGYPSTPNHPQVSFLAWLEDADIEDLPSISDNSQLQPHLVHLPSDLETYLGSVSVMKLRRILAPFGPVSGTLVETEIKLLRETMEVTSPGELTRILIRAASEGYDSIVEAFHDRGLDMTERDSTGESPLTLAASRGKDSVVQLLLAQLLMDSPTVYTDFQSGRYPAALWNASKNGHISTVRHLIKLMNKSNASPAEQLNIPLILAAGNGHDELVKTLIACGADTRTHHDQPNDQEWAGLEPMIRKVATMEVLKSCAYGGVQFWGDLNVYPPLVASILNDPDHHLVSLAIAMRTALQAAAEGGHLSTVNLLLQNSAEINDPPAEFSGRTALQAAAGGGHLDVVNRLLRKGAGVNAAGATFSGRTALQAAAAGGHLEVVNRLLEEGAEVHAPPAHTDGRTALQAAAGGGHLDVVDRLLAEGAEVNAPPSSIAGRTALQAAAGGDHLNVVNRLLENGAEVNAMQAHSEGRTALESAEFGGYRALVRRLREVGAESPRGSR